MKRSSDARLVRGLVAGDDTAYEELVRTHTGKMFGVARRLLGPGADAEDAVQEALLAAWKSIASFDGRSALATWLHRITVNTSLAKLAKRKKEVPMDDLPERTADNDRPAPDPVEQADLARLVWGAVDALREELRTVLVLRDVEGMPSKDVAAALGISDASVRQRLHRGRQTVAEHLRPELCTGREMTCGGRLDLLFDFMDDELTADVREPVSAHVAACGDCQSYVERYRRAVSGPLSASASTVDEAPQTLIAALLERPRGGGERA